MFTGYASMQVSLEKTTATYRISSYETTAVTIAYPAQAEKAQQDDSGLYLSQSLLEHETLTESFVIMPDKLLRRWAPAAFEKLQQDHFATLLDYRPEIVLFGSGPRIRRPETALLAPLINQGIGVEIMDIGAACRTYNILMADDRYVAAALLLGTDS